MKKMWKQVIGLCVFITMFVLFGKTVVVANANPATEYQMSVATNRQEETCNYQVSGIDLEQVSKMELWVSYTDETGAEKNVMQQEILLDATNCVNGVYEGAFHRSELEAAAYTQYKVSVLIQEQWIVGDQVCDFSINDQLYKVSGDKNTSGAIRTIKLQANDGLELGKGVPGTENFAFLLVSKVGAEQTSVVQIGAPKALSGTAIEWKIDVWKACGDFGTYEASIYVGKQGKEQRLSTTKFVVESKITSLTTKKTKALEKKNRFSITLKGLKNPFTLKSLSFYIYDSKGNLAFVQTGKDKTGNGKQYYAEVDLKSLKYKLDKYTVKACMLDEQGRSFTLKESATADQRATVKKFTITKNKKLRTSKFKLKNAYIPGNIKKVQFWVYYKEDDEFILLDKVNAEYKKEYDTYVATEVNKYPGSYRIDAYGYTNWGKKILLKSQSLKVQKSESAKNGWFYEKYNGKTYKFYYIDNVKQTDLTKILGLKYSSTTNVNNFYIYVNRAACCVTVYAYDEEKQKYIIPVKSFAVSVGADIYTEGGASGLNTNTSYTPLGTYSICTNGISPKFSLKPMYEPNNVILYARWTSHIVGTVYFHSIAVGSDSHYALNPYQYNRLGSPASAGCIRMTVADAKWIYDYASVGSTVKIEKGTATYPGPIGKPNTIKISSSIHYDPTDPEVPDSRKKADYKNKLISGYMKSNGEKVGY